MGFLKRMFSLENTVSDMGPIELGLWLYLINSDVLSSVEKKSPEIMLKESPTGESKKFIIQRSDRHLEGEECLVLLEEFDSTRVSNYLLSSEKAHLLKLRARVEYLSKNRNLLQIALKLGESEL